MTVRFSKVRAWFRPLVPDPVAGGRWPNPEPNPGTGRRIRLRQPVPATGSAAVNPAAQPATNLREAVLGRTVQHDGNVVALGGCHLFAIRPEEDDLAEGGVGEAPPPIARHGLVVDLDHYPIRVAGHRLQ